MRAAFGLPSALFGLALTGMAAFAQDVAPYEGADQLPEMRFTTSEGAALPAPGQDLATILDLAEYVGAASGGKIVFEPYWSNSLLSYAEAADGVASGTADMANALTVYTPAEFPVTNWLNTLTNRLKGGQPYGKLVALGAVAEFYATNDDLQREYDEHGLHVVGSNGGTAYDLFCSKPVKSLADAKGTQTRTANQAVAKEVESMGFSPVSIAANEIYEAFTRGIIKCVYLFPAGYETQLATVPGEKYWIHLDLSGWMNNLHIFNKAKWDAMPPLARKIITDGYVRYLAHDAETTFLNTRKFGQRIKDGQITAVQPDAELLAALHAHQDKVVAELAASAPPVVTDPQAAIDQFTGLIDKWRKIVSDELKIPDVPDDANAVVDAWMIDYDFKPFQDRLIEELTKAMQSRQRHAEAWGSGGRRGARLSSERDRGSALDCDIGQFELLPFDQEIPVQAFREAFDLARPQ